MITPQKKMVRRFNDNSSRVELRKFTSLLGGRQQFRIREKPLS